MHLWKGDNKFGLDPPPSFGQNPKEQQLFSYVEIQDLLQIIGILEEIDSFSWPKMHLWKGDKKLGRALPPPHLDKIQKNSSIS